MARGDRTYLMRLWGEAAVDPAAGPLSRRARALLARLALHPGGIERAEAAALLWPERTDAQALANLRQLLHDHGWLNRGEAPLLLVTRDRLDLDRALLATDDAALLAAAADPGLLAETLARTDPRFLAGLDAVGEEFEQWRSAERRRAEDRLRAAAHDAAARATAAGDTGAAARIADAWARFDPCDEAMARTGLAADGDAAAVRRRMSALTANLAADLGVQPSPETRRAEAEALARVNGGHDSTAVAPAAPVESPRTAATPLTPAAPRRTWRIAAASAMIALAAGGGWLALRPARHDSAAATAQTRRAEALTLSARQLVAARNRNAYAKAAELARTAIADDPTYAPAWTELAIARWLPAWWAEQDEPGARERIRTEALGYLDRALALSPGLPRALAAKGLILTGPEGTRWLEQAIATDPPDADIWQWMANARILRHDLRGGLAARIRATELAPTNHRIANSYIQLAMAMGRDDLAVAAMDRFARVATDQYAVEVMRLGRLMRQGHLGDAATRAAALLNNGPADLSRLQTPLAWAARATGDLAAVKGVTASNSGLRTSYAAIYDPAWAEARLMQRPDAFLDDIMADAESRALVQQGKGRLLLSLAAGHPARFADDPAGTCCRSLGANLVVAMRQAGKTGEAAALLVKIERDTAAAGAAGLDDDLLPVQRMLLACLHGDGASAAGWLGRAIDKGWRGQEEFFAADPADEPACAKQAKQPQFAAARARLLALTATERPAVAAATRRAIAFLQKNPPVTPPADGR